ncbi:MAG: CopD family protein [Proteobacteria bacterium]|nr:CopD family protein [Pseudomonadota bacterium]MBI3497114.1 CopD family protein [Pseudomonadota bacterium]
MDAMLGILRAAHLSAALSLFGVLLFRASIAPPVFAASGAAAAPVDARLHRLAVMSALVALATACLWLPLQTRAMAGADDFARSLVQVLSVSRFGTVLLLRAGLIVAILLALGSIRRRPAPWHAAAAALAGLGLALHAAIGHGAAIGAGTGWLAGLANGLHLLAAGAWLGGLVPLLWSLALPLPAAAEAARRFSPVGIASVATIAVTALVQSWFLVGSIPALVGTLYGALCLVKLLLFAFMLALAALNRWRLAPAVSGDQASPAARSRLRLSIGAEIGVGLSILGAAGLLATSAPGAHQQPWWPFPLQPSRAALQIPELYLEAFVACYGIAVGLIVMLLAGPYRRLRWVAMPLGAAFVLFFSPGLRLFAVEALPTTFWTSPTGFTASSVMRGRALFAEHCVICHGHLGRGNGPAAAGLRARPADLTAEHFFDHADGDLYWWISNGMNEAMPAFEGVIEVADRWQLIDFLHANAASTRLWDATFLRPVPAPDIPVSCPGGGPAMLSDMVGQPVHLVFADPATPVRLTNLAALAGRLSEAGAVTVVVGHAGLAVPPSLCVADSPEAAPAYAEIAGIALESMPGGEFLIDRARWLRQVWLPADDPSSTGTAVLLERIAALRRMPVASGAIGPHIH